MLYVKDIIPCIEHRVFAALSVDKTRAYVVEQKCRRKSSASNCITQFCFITTDPIFLGCLDVSKQIEYYSSDEIELWQSEFPWMRIPLSIMSDLTLAGCIDLNDADVSDYPPSAMEHFPFRFPAAMWDKYFGAGADYSIAAIRAMRQQVTLETLTEVVTKIGRESYRLCDTFPFEHPRCTQPILAVAQAVLSATEPEPPIVVLEKKKRGRPSKNPEFQQPPVKIIKSERRKIVEKALGL